LSTCGFRLPDEAQKIDRLLCSFAQCYFEDNAGDNTCCPFKDEDTVYLLVFAIVMLNTDLHKVDNLKSKRRQQKKMTKTDFTNNLKNAVQSEGVPKAFLGRVYDAILAKPISLLDCNMERSSNDPSTPAAIMQHIVANAQKADALLRSCAVHEYPFLSITDLVENLQVCGDDAATDMSRSCVSRTWHYWYGAVNSCLSTAHLDPHGLVPAIDVLVYGLSVSVCLDMPMERSAFLWQVVRLRSFDDRRHGHFLDEETAKVREEKWFAELDAACTGLVESKLSVLRKIHEWGKTLRLRLQLDVKARMELSVAVQELEKGDYLLQDPARTFLQSGNLMKISARTGRTADYRFYLFSDVMLYASKDPKTPMADLKSTKTCHCT
jgi:Sec7 domain